MKLNEIAALNVRAARGPRGKPGRDEHVRVSPEDATAGFLEDKLQAGDGIRLHKRERNGVEALVIDAIARSFGGGGGGGTVVAHPNLAAHDALGLVTQTELDAHASTSHGEEHPNLAAHDALGLATDAEMAAAIAAAVAAHAATPHGSAIPSEIGFST